MKNIEIELEVIKNKVETHFNLNDISKNTNKRDYVVARYVYFKFSRLYTKKSYKEISGLVNRDHSSVTHGLNELDSYLASSLKYRKLYQKLYAIFSGKIYESDLADMETLKDTIIELEKEIHSLTKTHVPEHLQPLIEILNEVPENHIKTVQLRLEAIVKMLPKPHQIRS